MTKYNKSNIMKRAWSLVKGIEITLSEALKKAWAEAKELLNKITFDGFAKVLIPGKEDYLESESNYMTFKLWEKGTKKRVYINDCKRRSYGFIDCNTKEMDIDGNSDATAVAKKFVASYIF